MIAGLLLGAMVVAVGALAVFVLPPHLAPRSAFTSAGDAVRAQNDVRGVLVQTVGGLVLLLGAYATWRQVQLGREGLRQSLDVTNAQLKAAQGQLTVAQESQLTQRFTQAVDQLGSDQVVVRMGGIYALERLARNSAADSGMVAELLSSYIRQHAPLADADDEIPEHLELRAADVRAALFVLKKGTVLPEGDEPLRLLGTDLRKAGLDHARLAGADLEGADLRWAWLRWACLDGADLSHIDLRNAHLGEASLLGAELNDARLGGAHLEGASLLGADITGAQFEGAVASPETLWPDGFDPVAAGVIIAPAAS